jgi:hypothetical protein
MTYAGALFKYLIITGIGFLIPKFQTALQQKAADMKDLSDMLLTSAKVKQSSPRCNRDMGGFLA